MFSSFLQIKNDDVSDNLRHSITLDKNSGSGQLLLSSTKLNCACKFVKNYDNSSIDTEKALSSLPKFKEIFNHENQKIFDREEERKTINQNETIEKKEKEKNKINIQNNEKNIESFSFKEEKNEKIEPQEKKESEKRENYDEFRKENPDFDNKIELLKNKNRPHGIKNKRESTIMKKPAQNAIFKKTPSFFDSFGMGNYPSSAYFGDFQVTKNMLPTIPRVPEYPSYDDLLGFYYARKRQELMAKSLLNPIKPAPFYSSFYELN